MDEMTGPTNADHDFVIGEKVLIRTLTLSQVGSVIGVTPRFVTLSNASWLVSTGRFDDCLRTGKIREHVAIPGTLRVGLATIVDVSEWIHPLPE